MRRWFLSYNSQDLALMQGVEAALRHKDPDAKIFFAPKSLRAGGYWLPELAKEIAEATAFALLVGEKGLGPWQVTEYYEALDRRVKETSFPVVFILLDGQPAPGLPFLRQLHWIVSADPASEQSLARLMDAVGGASTRPGELWRYTAPYRGLAAMTESDSDFFFGRDRQTVDLRHPPSPAVAGKVAGLGGHPGRRQPRAGTGRRARRLGPPGLARRRRNPRPLAAGLPRHPPLVLSPHAAGARADQGAGRAVPAHL